VLGLASDEHIRGELADRGTGEQPEPFAEEIVIREAATLPYGGDWSGTEGLRGLMDTIASVAKLSVSDVEVFDAGDGHVITRQTANFTIEATGASLSVPMVEVYELREGQITVIDVYYKDTQAMNDLFASAAS
jgi:ketosteroid isomerase-like protein